MLNLREAKLSDLKDLLELEQKVIEAERPYNSAIKPAGAQYYDIEHLIAGDNSLLVVVVDVVEDEVENNNKIVGTGYAQIRQSKASLVHALHSYLGFMYVAPDFRGQGINKQVIDYLISWSKNKGVSDLYLDVYAENSGAIRAYEKVGFKSSLVEMQLSL